MLSSWLPLLMGVVASIFFTSVALAAPLAPGQAAPWVPLPTVEGRSFSSLGEFRGKKILLNFWATWCAPCVAEMPELERFAQSKKDSTVVLAVAVDDSKEDVLRLQKKLGLSFKILLDNGAKLAGKYSVQGFPETFLIDQQGKVQFLNDGAKGLVLRIVGPRMWNSPLIAAQF